MSKLRRGFTLIEILLVIGLIAILAAIVIIAINPARQFAQARDTQRSSDVVAILNAVHQNMIDNRGTWTCPGYEPIPSVATTIASTGYDICDCLIPDFLPELTVDPVDGTWAGDCATAYDTAYTIASTTGGRITITAPSAELRTISITR